MTSGLVEWRDFICKKITSDRFDWFPNKNYILIWVYVQNDPELTSGTCAQAHIIWSWRWVWGKEGTEGGEEASEEGNEDGGGHGEGEGGERSRGERGRRRGWRWERILEVEKKLGGKEMRVGKEASCKREWILTNLLSKLYERGWNWTNLPSKLHEKYWNLRN